MRYLLVRFPLESPRKYPGSGDGPDADSRFAVCFPGAASASRSLGKLRDESIFLGVFQVPGALRLLRTDRTALTNEWILPLWPRCLLRPPLRVTERLQ